MWAPEPTSSERAWESRQPGWNRRGRGSRGSRDVFVGSDVDGYAARMRIAVHVDGGVVGISGACVDRRRPGRRAIVARLGVDELRIGGLVRAPVVEEPVPARRDHLGGAE